MFSVRNLSLQVEDRVLIRDLSFSASPGEVIALLGPSGSGKTSLLQKLVGTKLAAKKVHFRGTWAEIPQSNSLNLELSALQNARVGLLQNRTFWSGFLAQVHEKERVQSLLRDWGISDPEQKTELLSGGEKQRVCVVRALLTEWSLLLADEPISQLDQAMARRVLEALRTENKKRGSVLIWSLHQPEFAHEYSDRVFRFDGDGGVST